MGFSRSGNGDTIYVGSIKHLVKSQACLNSRILIIKSSQVRYSNPGEIWDAIQDLAGNLGITNYRYSLPNNWQTIISETKIDKEEIVLNGIKTIFARIYQRI